MTSHTTKQAARAYQRKHGVPYAEARRRVMDAAGPPSEIAPGHKDQPDHPSLTLGVSEVSSDTTVSWTSGGALGIFGPIGNGKTVLAQSMIAQWGHESAPALVITNQRYPDCLGARLVSMDDVPVDDAAPGDLGDFVGDARLVVVDAVDAPEDLQEGFFGARPRQARSRSILDALVALQEMRQGGSRDPWIVFTSATVPSEAQKTFGIHGQDTDEQLLAACDGQVVLGEGMGRGELSMTGSAERVRFRVIPPERWK